MKQNFTTPILYSVLMKFMTNSHQIIYFSRSLTEGGILFILLIIRLLHVSSKNYLLEGVQACCTRRCLFYSFGYAMVDDYSISM